MATIMFSHGPIPKDEASIVHALLNDINIDKVWLTSPWGGRIVWKKKTITYDSGRKRTIRVPALGYHQGKDIQPKGAKKRGTGIYSPITGKVFILPGGYSEHNGICIWDSTNNIAVVLLHMDVINPNTGVPYFSEYSTVEKGDQVGRMADIGSEDKVHLHYSIGMCYKENDAKNATFLSYQSYLKGQQEWNRLYGSQIKVDPHQCHIADAYEEWEKSPGSGLRKPYPDPLVLDLDGDGIETVSVKDFPTYFDHDGDWFAEQTGWVASDDGVLAMDRDGDGIISNGRELFGDQTILEDGRRAADGFQALAEFDDNKDGKIDVADGAYLRLRVWRGVEGNGSSLPDELFTLEELGIKSINLGSSATGVTDARDNTENRLGSFEKVDGTTGQIADYSFQRDAAYTYANEVVDVPEDIAALPDLPGYGKVKNLQQAMAIDDTGQLKSLVEEFMAETDISVRNALMEEILFKWAGDERLTQEQSTPTRLPRLSGGGGSGGGGGAGGSISVGTVGDLIDDRKLAVLEHFFGEPWTGAKGPNPDYGESVYLKESYRELFELWYSELMAQSHLKDLYDEISVIQDDTTEKTVPDFSAVVAHVQMTLVNDPERGKQLLGEFARALRGDVTFLYDHYLSVREAFIQQDPDLGWIFDSGGLPVYDGPHQGIRWWSGEIEGTHGSDAIKGSLTFGYGRLDGLTGDDVIYGTDRDERLHNWTGDAILVGGGGNDTLASGEGDDILDGGQGDDFLSGGVGNDTYLFRKTSGHDVIYDRDATPGNMDTIWLGSDLTPDDLVFRRVGDHLVLRIIDTSDTLTVRFYFTKESTLNRIERIQFMNGWEWDQLDILIATQRASEGDDIVYGTSDWDTIRGLGGNDEIHGLDGWDKLHGDSGNDTIYGGEGEDHLDGATGDDSLDGGPGGDTYHFSRGYDHDTIDDTGTDTEHVDRLQFDDGILPDDVQTELVGNDLKLTIIDTGDSVTIKNWLNGETPGGGVEVIQFVADGTEWTLEGITKGFLRGSYWDDYIKGFSTPDIIEGFGGNDYIDGRDGDDIIDGGTGDDTLWGGHGNDTLLGGEGDDRLQGVWGNDILDGGPGNDRLEGFKGDDTYLFDRGSGNDTIHDFGWSGIHDFDTIRLADDIRPEDVTLERVDDPEWSVFDHLKLSIIDTGDTLTMHEWFGFGWDANDGQIEFSDDTTWTFDAIRDMLIQGTPGDDVLIGYSVYGVDYDGENVGDQFEWHGMQLRWRNDEIFGHAGNDEIIGCGGDDTLSGDEGNDRLSGETGNDTLLGGDGDDILVGGFGDDTLSGGPGNDALYGGRGYSQIWAKTAGNDTFLFGRGSGQDTVFDCDRTPGNVDAIVLDPDIISTDVTIRRVDERLVLSITGTTDTLTVENWFLDMSYEWEGEEFFDWQVEEIHFADGTTWDVDTIKLMVLQGTPQRDVLIGYSSADVVDGLAGNDEIYGRGDNDFLSGGSGDDKLFGEDGQDTLAGGAGRDELVGGAGADTLDGGADDDVLRGGLGDDEYRFGRNLGQDRIIDQDSTPGNLDAIVLDADLSPDDVTVRHINNSLVLSIIDTNDTLSVENWFFDDSTAWQVEEIRFADGTTWDVNAIKYLALQGTAGDDILTGYSDSDTILGLAGNDEIYGRGGDDTLVGGAGEDHLFGGFGNDIYIFERGSDRDVIVDWDPSEGNIDTVRLGVDVLPSDVSLTRAGNHLFVSINGTDDSLQLSDWFTADAFKIEQIQFGDGAVWDTAYMYTMTTTPSDADDYLVGSPDKDLIDGGGGNDYVEGRESDDTLFGGSGVDHIYGNDDNDTLYGGSQDDHLDGGSGDDRVFGEDGDDYLVAGSGSDYLDGGADNDLLVAGSGHNHLVGGSGEDRLESGTGTNILEGGLDDDEIVATQGTNTILFQQGDGFDTVTSRLEQLTVEEPVLVQAFGEEVTGVRQMVDVNGTLFFVTVPLVDSGQSETLWQSDGTGAGTFPLYEVYPDTPANPAWLTHVNGTLLFTADHWDYGRELWKSDGTDAGTVMVKDIAPGSGGGGGEGEGADYGTASSSPQELTTVNGTLFFTADDGNHGYEIWKSDGTEAGTVMVKDIVSESSGSNPYQLTDVNGTLFFTANDGVHGSELWMSDGTEAGTDMVKDITSGSGSSSISSLTDVNDTLFFTANDGVYGSELWVSDGTEAGTVMVKDISSGSSSTSLHSFTNVNGTLFFTANDGIHGRELWRSDGTEAGTFMVMDSNPDAGSIDYTDLVVVGDTLFFVANDGIHGRELWKSDGTEAGTVMVKDIRPDQASGNPDELTSVNGTLYFRAYDVEHGMELWKSDGTEAGTVMVHDVREGSSGSYPSELTNANGTLFFTAEYGFFGSGFGLWKLDTRMASSNEDADTISFGPGITPEDLSIQTRIGELDSGEYGVQLLIGTGDGEGMLIEAASYGDGSGGGGDGGGGDIIVYTASNTSGTDVSLSDLAIKTFAFDDGTLLSLDDILARADGTIGYQEGTDGNETLWGSNTADEIYGVGGSDHIMGRDGVDWLDGGEGDDVIAAGEGDDEGVGGGLGADVLAGQSGKDYLFGDEGDDVYAFNRNDGQDYIDNTSLSGAGGVDTLSFGVSINPEDITAYISPADPEYTGNGADLVLQIQDSSDQVKVWYFETLGGDITSEPLSRVQFIDANGDARVYDLLGIVQALQNDLEAANADNPVALFTTATAQFELTGTVGIAGGDHAVAYAVTGDLFAVSMDVQGTAGNDTIEGSIGQDTIESGDGNDTISSGLGNDEISSGDGADTIYAGDGNDVIDAGNGTDFIDAGAGDDVIRGLQGGDTALGGSGDDTYEFNPGDSTVTIEDTALPGEGNTIVFGDGISADSLTLVPGDDALTLKVGDSGDEIILKVFDGSDVLGTYAVGTFRFADGSQMSFSELVARGFNLEGTEGEDLLLGTSLNDHIIALGGDDLIVAGSGTDLLEGGSGDDTYWVNLGDGVDTIVDAPAPGAGNSIAFGQGIFAEDLTLGVDGDNLVIHVGSAGDALYLEGFNPDDPYNTVTVETFRFADGTVLSSTDLLNLGFTFEGTPDADTLAGTAARDLFIGHEGNDSLTGGLGDDTYRYNPGDGVDTITDESTLMDPNMLVFGEGISAEDITLSHDPTNATLILNIGSNGDAIHFIGFDANDPYGTHAVEFFQFSNGQVLVYDQLLDKGFDISGTSEADSLTGTATTDRITAGDGADTLAGGRGDDFLTGGLGDDRYLFNLGDGVDVIDDIATIDAGNTLVFGEGEAEDRKGTGGRGFLKKSPLPPDPHPHKLPIIGVLRTVL